MSIICCKYIYLVHDSFMDNDYFFNPHTLFMHFLAIFILRKLKTCMRSNLKQDRFSGLSLLLVHLNIDDINV